MHRTTITHLSTAALAALLLGSCRSTGAPSQQLVEARHEYQRAASSPAAQYAPANLEAARNALLRAEAAAKQDPHSGHTEDLAYIARRAAQVAEAEGNLVIVENDASKAENDLKIAAQEKASSSEQKLEQTKEELAKVEAQKEAEKESDQTKLNQAEEDLQHERLAKSALENAGNVKEDARGTVVTIPGELLFATGRAQIQHGAEEKLTAVVDALGKLGNRSIIVEGYTDSTGSRATNQRLSEARAQAVKDFLVKHGIPAERIEARGMGQDNPVESNDTPEGRAANRRAEIIVSNPIS
jgi:outer membrane protein OmpA-like peptidoglycan-associated protein